MSVDIIIQVILFGIALSMDAFAVSISQGLTYTDLNKKKSVFIATTYGLFQALFPLAGYWIVEIAETIVKAIYGEVAGVEASIAVGNIMASVVSWISFILLLYIGGKMLLEAIQDMKKVEEEKEIKKFTYKEVLIMGVATAIDALATGVAFHSGVSTNTTIYLHVVIIMICTFIISFIGVTLSHQVHKLLKGKYEITGIIGGIILISLGLWVIIGHYLGI